MRRIYLLLLLLTTLSSIRANEDAENEVGTSEKDQLDLIAADESENEIDNETEGGYKEDPCVKVRCGPGKVCEINEKGVGTCVCIKECPPETDERRKVCNNYNETWNSDCEIYRMRCLCTEDHESCKNKKYKHGHVDYYGGCRDIPTCTEEQMADFPRRMREWLSNVMRDLAKRKELQEQYLQLELEAEKDLLKKWINAVIWKFCDLDSHPFDRSVSRHELFPIRAPLLAMEHCIAPFLDGCDADNDHRISLKEWGLCLGLEETEIEDKCADIRNEE